MGCDIHLYSETLTTGAWQADKADTFAIEEEGTDEAYPEMADSYEGSRNYWLFGLLHNGVRTKWPWSFEGRGFPNNASSEVGQIYAHWDVDAHSASYLTVQELKEKAAELLLIPDAEAVALTGYITKLLEGLPASTGTPAEQRIVFWFDN